MRRELASGVTTLRVMGQELGVDFTLAREIDRGLSMGPELLCAGRHLTKPGHHGHALTAVSDLNSLRELALDNIRRGASHLKIFATGGLSSSTDPNDCPFSLEELREAVRVAHQSGLPIAAHAIGVADAAAVPA